LYKDTGASIYLDAPLIDFNCLLLTWAISKNLEIHGQYLEVLISVFAYWAYSYKKNDPKVHTCG